MVLSIEQAIVPPFPTRAEVAKILQLTYAEVRRIDAEGWIKRAPMYGSPVRYVGKSVRDFGEGKFSR